MIKFQTTITEIKTFSKAECKSSANNMKKNRYNRIVEVSCYELADLIKEGHSFFPAVCDLTNYTLRDIDWRSQQLFAADIDHGNLSIEEVYEYLNKLPLKLEPCVIYESHSSTAEVKKYRALFLADCVVDAVEDATLIQKFLVVLFGKDYQSTEEVDYTIISPGQLFFGTHAEKTMIVNETTFNTQELLDYCKEINVEEQYEILKQTNLKYRKEKRDAEKGLGVKKESTKKASKSKKEVVESTPKVIEVEVDESTGEILTVDEESKLLMERVLENLSELGKTMFVPQIDVLDGIEFINKLPLTKILGYNTEEKFNCYFHDDSTPSAHINNNNLYYCFGCKITLNTFEVINRILNQVKTHSILDVQKAVFNAMGIQLGSDYQRNVMDQIRYNRQHIDRLIMAHKKEENPVIKKLLKANRIGILQSLYLLSEMQCPLEPLTKTNENYAVLFVSVRHLQGYMLDHGYTGAGSISNLNSKIINLCEMGFIERVKYEDIKDRNLSKILDLQAKVSLEQLKYRHRILEMESQYSANKNITSVDVKKIYYYRLNFLTLDILNKAEDFLDFTNSLGMKRSGKGQKQLGLVNPDLADAIYLQTSLKLSKGDKKFLKDVDKFIDKRISEFGYFTEDDLLMCFDKGRNIFKRKSQRQLVVDQLMPFVSIEKELKSSRVNKETRSKFNIPSDISSNSKIYIKK